MNTTQQLFQINKRINQIKRNLQSRQQKANQWSVPYQKILHNNHQLSQTYHSNFRNSHNDNFKSPDNRMIETFYTKTQRKQFFQKKVKQSRKKINNFHNQLKQLQQLQEKRTKLYVKKQNQQKINQKQNFDKYHKKSMSLQNQVKNICNTFTNSLIFNGLVTKTQQKKSQVRTIKDRVNPFVGFRVQKMIQLYQQTKNSGRQNYLNLSLGVGLQTTPYSNLKRQIRKTQQNQDKQAQQQEQHNNLRNTHNTNCSKSIQKQKQPLPSFNNLDNKESSSQIKHTFNRNFSKILQSKINDKKQIYLLNDFKREGVQNKPQMMMKNNSKNVFKNRMKRLLKQSSNFQQFQGNYVQMLKRNKAKTVKGGGENDFIGKIRANNTYKTVFQNS